MKFSSTVKEGGLILYDSSAGAVDAPQGRRAIPVPATAIAAEAGALQGANIVMLGALMETGMLGLPRETLIAAVNENLSRDAAAASLNTRLLEAGARALDR